MMLLVAVGFVLILLVVFLIVIIAYTQSSVLHGSLNLPTTASICSRTAGVWGLQWPGEIFPRHAVGDTVSCPEKLFLLRKSTGNLAPTKDASSPSRFRRIFAMSPLLRGVRT
ncbi:hypothetical protein MRX96_011488 [Rhipicephalus microplus]